MPSLNTDNMKRLFLFFAVCFTQMSHSQFCNSQVDTLGLAQSMIVYSMDYRVDTNNLEVVSTEEMLLLIGDGISCYQSNRLFKFYQEVEKKRQEGTLMKWLTDGSSVNEYVSYNIYKIYKGYPSNKITTIDNAGLEGMFQYEENIDLFDWVIYDDTTSINGYFSQKATCNYGGRLWIAWFTPEIPYMEGPYKFCGLPGLIVKLEDSQRHYSFIMQSIIKLVDDVYIEWEDKNYFKTTRCNFLKARYNASQTIIESFKDNNTFGQNSVVYEKMNNLYQSRNNPIELDKE